MNRTRPGSFPSTSPAPVAAGSSILLIDDDAGHIRLLSEMLSGEGHRLYAALSGEEGLRLALRQPPALVLVDRFMPGMDGVATCRLFKASASLCDIPIIFLTGSDLLEHKLHAFAEGAVDYIVKPFSADEVVARVRVHLRLAAARGKILPAPAAEPPGETPGWQDPEERMVRLAQGLLLRDLSATITLAELAHTVGSNERSLTEAFRRHTGMPVFEFLRQERFRGACQLLLHSPLPIGKIGELMGFKSAAAFTFAFRQHCAMTPSEYRITAGIGSAAPPEGGR